MLDYSKIPVSRMTDAMRSYMEHGLQPGHFLTALLSNDLMECCRRADEDNGAALFRWCSWLYNEAPIGSFGSPEAVRLWMKSKADERANH